MRTIIIQFGGTGDLAVKKLYPAYRNLMGHGYEFEVLALGRRYTDREEFLKETVDKDAPKSFTDHLDYLFYDTSEEQAVPNL
ncbi:MAG TPA: glucose-6-phosphate dehydrogenase, partial [Sphaerochaeta sp.]|nr:glucose-6-phosphate dehydrogenase [Sphaerochaeta sp.]